MIKNHPRIQNKLRYELGNEVIASLEDPLVTDVVLNEDTKLWAESLGIMKYIGKMPTERAHNLLRTVASILGTSITQQSPNVGGEIYLLLKDKYQLLRFQGVIPPLVSSPIFGIRKPAHRIFSLDEYREQRVITERQQRYLKKAVSNRANILIAGGTGTGKTTLINAMLDEIAKQFCNERIAILEDTIELQCNIANKIQLHTSDQRSMDDLLYYCLRLRPDRIVIGEVRRSKETQAYIRALNTGHQGGIASVHSNDARCGLLRIEQLIQETGMAAIPEAIIQAINVVIFIERSTKSPVGRQVKEILEVKGYNFVTRQYITYSVSEKPEDDE